jgi:peptide/nickel transport system substrate-binding protein
VHRKQTAVSVGETLSRRELVGYFLKVGASLGAAGSLLAGSRPAASAPAQTGQPGPSATARRGGRVVFVVGSDPYSPGPYVFGGGAGYVVNGNIYNSLMRFAPSGRALPELAESYLLVDPKTYIFKLRKGVKFHAGGEMTADDVKFSLDLYASGKVGATRQGQLKSSIAATTATDKYTVKIALQDPNATFLELLALRDLPIISKSWLEAGHDYRNEWNGTGAFKMAEAVRGERYRLVRNDEYFKPGLPYLNEIEVRVIHDEFTRADGVKAGRYDIADFFPWQQARAFQTNPALALVQGTSVFNAIVLNQSRPPFNDVRVRQAVSYAIDRAAVNRIGFGGYGIPTPGGLFVKPSPWFCEENAAMYPYQPERARALLRDAGHPQGITMDLVLANFAPYLDPFAVVQQNLSAVGIKVNVISTDTGGMAEFRVNGKYQALWTGTLLIFDDPDAYSTFYESTGPFYGRATGFKDADIDALFAQGRRELDYKKRKEIYCRLEHKALEGAYWALINWRPNIFGLRADVKGFQPMPGVLQVMTPIELERTWLDRPPK